MQFQRSGRVMQSSAYKVPFIAAVTNIMCELKEESQCPTRSKKCIWVSLVIIILHVTVFCHGNELQVRQPKIK